jgi:hypothetical protein
VEEWKEYEGQPEKRGFYPTWTSPDFMDTVNCRSLIEGTRFWGYLEYHPSSENAATAFHARPFLLFPPLWPSLCHPRP